MKKIQEVEKANLYRIPTPEYTRSWHPVPHYTVVDTVEKHLADTGIEVTWSNHLVTGKGDNLFSNYRLDIPLPGGGYTQLAIRNSTSKKFAVGMAGGAYAMNCTNLCFSGEWTSFRKHTGGLDFQELVRFIGDALSVTVAQAEDTWQWQNRLREFPLTDQRFKTFTFDLINREILVGSKFGKYLECVGDEVKEAGDLTLYQAHGGFTRLIRGDDNLHRVPDLTRKLTGLCDDYRELLAA